MTTDIQALLGEQAEDLLTHRCQGIAATELTLPGPNYIDETFATTDRSIPVIRSFQQLLAAGRLGGHRLFIHPAGGSGN